MTTLIDPKNNIQVDPTSSSAVVPVKNEKPAERSDQEEILHLKRLLVTMKQHYETMLHQLQVQCESESKQKAAFEKEVAALKGESQVISQLQQEEIDALGAQLYSVKELLRQAQEEVEALTPLEGTKPYVRDYPEIHQEMEMLREEADRALKRSEELEKELTQQRSQANEKIAFLQKIVDEPIDAADSNQVLSFLKNEMEMISRLLVQGTQDKTFEKKYLDLLAEKSVLDHQCKHLQHQIDHQSANLNSFQAQLHHYEGEKRQLEAVLLEKDGEKTTLCGQIDELKRQMCNMQQTHNQREKLQDKYDELKESYLLLVEKAEEDSQLRTQAENAIAYLESHLKEQEAQLLQKGGALTTLTQDVEKLSQEKEHSLTALEEAENRLKVAQQHLAKKVKESTLLSEKMHELAHQLNESYQTVESQKNQLTQLQAAVDLYQKQEEKLQEQIHQLLKGTETQASKWEEKYFHMYSKWQESETKIKELKKYEEKCFLMQNQMQSIFGNFMTTSSAMQSHLLFQQQKETAIPPNRDLVDQDNLLLEDSPERHPLPPAPPEDARYDLFGMRYPSEDRYNSHSPS